MKGVDTMAFYRICPDCGAYLDPGEQCSCHEECLIEMERKEKANRLVLYGGAQMKDTEKVHTAPYIPETCRKHGKTLR